MHSFAGRAEDLGVINTFLLAAWAVFRDIKKILEQLLRLAFLRVLGSGVVGSVIVIVPRREYRAGLLQLLISRLSTQQIPLLFEHRHVFRVAVDVVADEEEELRLRRDDALPYWLRLILFGTRPKRDPLQRLLSVCDRRDADQ